MRKVFFVILLFIVIYMFFPSSEYYIPKPKALIKINLPLQNTTHFSDEFLSFNYSNSANLQYKESRYSLIYPNYQSEINFYISTFDTLDNRIAVFYNNNILPHKNQGAFIKQKSFEDSVLNKYAILFYLDGDNIATSSQFFITDKKKYFVFGGMMFDSSINYSMSAKNEIMKKEVFNFLNSFNWSSN